MLKPATKASHAPTRDAALVRAWPGLPLWLPAAVLVLVTLLAYQPVWRAGFVWDDDSFLLNNPLIKAGNGLYGFWCTTTAPDYFPMTSTTLWLEWRLWGNHPLGYHLVNVLLHAASSLLLWRVLTRLEIRGAWLAAAIFALHPVNVESVAWITERKNTLAMFFYLLSLLWWLRSDPVPRPSTLGFERRWYWLGLGAFALALLSKTAVVTLPVVLLGLAWWRHGRIERRDLWRALPFFAIAGLLSLITLWFQSHRAIGSEVVRADSFPARLAGAGWAVWFYLYKALWPLNLSCVYPRWSIDATQPLSYLPGVLAVMVLVVGWHYRGRWGRPVLFAMSYFIVMLLPVLGFFNIYFMLFSLVADHWQYFSIPGPIALVAAALVAGGQRLGRAGWCLGVGLGAAALVGLGVLTWKQTHIYADRETLWRDTLARNPACWIAHNNIGVTLADKGRTDEAIRQYQDALRLKPDYAGIHYNLGVALADKGQINEAIRQFQDALRLRPDYVEAYNSLALALGEQGQTDEAIRQYQEALRFKPDDADLHYNLGIARGQQGQPDEAIRQFQEALRLNPNHADARCHLGMVLASEGQTDEAIRQYREALRLKPDFAQAHNNLGIALGQQGQTDEAIRQFQEAIRLNPDLADVHYNLGVALGEHGHIAEAIRQFQEALRLRPDYPQAHNNLGVALASTGQTDPAISQYQEAIRLKPDYAQAHNNLGNALQKEGQWAEAIAHYEKALVLLPGAIEPENNLAWLLATSPQAALRNGVKALELAQAVDRLSGGKNPDYLETLAAACAEAGQFPQAVEAAERALALAQSNPRVEQIRARLELYQHGKPCHEPVVKQ